MKKQQQIELAQQASPEWEGDLSDDCTACWAGLLLRAEEMDVNEWWWAVSHIEKDLEVDSSNNYSEFSPSTGIEARRMAESAAREFLGVSQRRQ